MEQKICQSCGMPMLEEQYGTEADGSHNESYCCYCYKDGAFAQECTLEEMVDFCAPFEVEGGRSKTIEEAKVMLMGYFPTLERWKAEKA
ncbi:MAG: zinc ribbon domain-containing protein [Lachnospiraceae bacterium]